MIEGWDERIARAVHLADEHPSAAEILTFYAGLAAFQKAVVTRSRGAPDSRVADRGREFREALPDVDGLVAAIRELLDWLPRAAPPPLARAVSDLDRLAPETWRHLFQSCWRSGGRHDEGADDIQRFCAEAVLQPHAEAAAAAARLQPGPPTDENTIAARLKPSPAIDANGDAGRLTPGPTTKKNDATNRRAPPPITGDIDPGQPRPTTDHDVVLGFSRASGASGSSRTSTCPICGGLPVAAVLREAGHGARRTLLCGFCLSEWAFPRVVCPACGEDRFERLSIYTAEEFAHVRLDACDTCRTYLKTIDLTKHGLAVPIVDELASVPLDLWARERGYTKLRPNLLRM